MISLQSIRILLPEFYVPSTVAWLQRLTAILPILLRFACRELLDIS
jgi:hypothetical protein